MTKKGQKIPINIFALTLQDDVVVSLEDNEVLSSPLVTKEDVKQYTIEINIFT